MADANAPLDNNHELTELRDLIWSAHAGEIDEAGLARLDELVQSSAEARRLYVDYVRLLADVQFDAGLLAESDAASGSFQDLDVPKPAMPISLVLPVSRASAFSFSRLTAWLLVAAVLTNLMVVGLMVVMLTPSLRKQIAWNVEPEDKEPATAEVLAKVVRATGAIWSKPLDAVQPGQSMDRGPRELSAGSIELEFSKGASVTLLGPIKFDVRSNGEVHLDQGRLKARVPREAIGFTVTTPQTTVVDLGTEFGVEADSTGTTEVHVFKGAVELQPNDGSGGVALTITLRAGQGRRVQVAPTSGDVALIEIAAAPNKFESSATTKANAWLESWAKHRETVTADPRLVALYDFQSRGETLVSHISDKFAGKIFCPNSKLPWVAGRSRDKWALAFGEQFAQVEVADAPELRLDEATLAVWLRVDAPPKEPTLIVGKGVVPARNYCLWLQPGGADRDGKPYFQWNLFTADGRNPIICASSSIELGAWYCVVGVASRERYALYVNGVEEVAGEPLKAALATSNDPLRFGQSPFDCPGRLTAVIDEVTIFKQPLSAEDIKNLYQVGKSVR